MALLKTWFLLTVCFQADGSSLAKVAPTPAEARVASWQVHEKMRKDSVFSSHKWEAIGPVFQGGRIECIATEPGKPTVLYVGVGSGGLWKSINNGTTWKPIFEQQSSIAVGDVAVSNSDSDTVWLGTGEVLLARSSLPGMGVFKSTDAGATWENMGLKDTQHIARVLIHPADANIVFVAAIGHQNSSNPQRGVFRTRDGGLSWDKVLHINDHTSAIDLVMHPTQPDVLLASMWQRATNSGAQHTGLESGIYKTTDAGDNWKRLGGGLPCSESLGRIAIAIAPSSPETVYALADEGKQDGFYRSADGGTNWTKMYDQLKAGWDWCELRVSPDNPNEVYSIGQNSFVTQDGGATFTKIAGEIVHLLPHGADVIHLDTHAMWINPADADHVIFGTDGGIFVSHDRCQTWLHYNNMPIAECYAVTFDMEEPANVYVGTQDNAALFGPVTARPKTGRPEEWQHVYLDRWGGGDSYFTYRDPVDSDTIFYEHQYGELRRKSMSSGRSRSIQPRLPGETLRNAWMTPFFPSRHADRTWYYAANRVFKSTNRGDDWTVISNYLVSTDAVPNLRYRAITALAESPLIQGLLFAGTDNADLFVTDDDGKSWLQIDSGLPKRAITRATPSPHDPNRVFVTLNGSGVDDYSAYVFRSDDRGTTWTDIGGNLPHEPAHVIVEDPKVPNLIYLGTDMGIYVSLNGGKQWQSLCSNLPTASVQDLFVHPRDNDLVIATHGRSCYVSDPATIQDAARKLQAKGL
ncbi:MAG: WD40/YVTN/BNR-like repeat-containing protein [Rubripirellula sp.]